MSFLSEIPQWLDYLFRGLFIFATLVFYAVALSRMGRSPYWALLGLLPYAAPVMIWVLAYAPWPQQQAVSPAQSVTD